MHIDALVEFYSKLTPGDVARFPEYYAADAYFKDPFNEVRGVDEIARIFRHMFAQLREPHFVVTERIAQAEAALLVWEFHFRMNGLGAGKAQLIRGATHLRFDRSGKVCYHRDYWDAAEELYMKLPLLGTLMRALRRRLAAR